MPDVADYPKISLRDLNADWLKILNWDLPYETADHAVDMIDALGPELVWEMVENEIPSGVPMPEELRTELQNILPSRSDIAEAVEAGSEMMAGRDISHVPRDFYGRWTRRRDLPGPPGEAVSDRYTRVREMLNDPDVGQQHRTDIVHKDENGNWTEERQRLHDQILEEFAEKFEHVPTDGQAILMGGLGGAGKTTLLRNNEDAAEALGLELDERGNPLNFVTVNADDFKGVLHDHGALPEVDGLVPGEAAVFAHEEASWLSKRAAAQAAAEGRNLIWDYTMGSADSARSRIEPLTDGLGPVYDDIKVVFVDVSADHSANSARARWERGLQRDPDGFGGRFVAEDHIRAAAETNTGNRSRNRDAFDEVIQEDWVSDWMLWDNDNFNGELVDSSLGGS